MTPIVVFVTTSSREEAQKIAEALLEANLAACISISSEISSHYRWRGKLTASQEFQLTIKTSHELWPLLGERVRELHSYECPEIVALPLVEADPDYLKWWQENLPT